MINDDYHHYVIIIVIQQTMACPLRGGIFGTHSHMLKLYLIDYAIALNDARVFSGFFFLNLRLVKYFYLF